MSQGCLGEKGVELAVTSGAEFGLWPEPSALGPGHQVMHRVAVHFPSAKFAFSDFRAGRERSRIALSGRLSGQAINLHCLPCRWHSCGIPVVAIRAVIALRRCCWLPVAAGSCRAARAVLPKESVAEESVANP